ncbi:hypothetical protein PCI56_15890 [Plesiomonas shigelloides subsp. oncorhynchi]|nr:hypothetical protein [Plesiomonas shigelloides]
MGRHTGHAGLARRAVSGGLAGDRFYRGNTAWRPWVYSFSIAVYCTSWTFFGTVGQASRDLWSLFLSISVPFWCLCLVGAYWGA